MADMGHAVVAVVSKASHGYECNYPVEMREYSRDGLEVALEEIGLVTLNFAVLNRDVIEQRVQFHGLVGGSSVLILIGGSR